MTQKEKILRHLKDYGSITPMDAFVEYGIMRLGARVWDLRHDGYNIETKNERSRNRYGEKVNYARYILRY